MVNEDKESTMDETIRLCREALEMLGDDGDLTQWTMLHTAALRDAVAVFAAERTDSERYRYLRNRTAQDVLYTAGDAAGCWIDCEVGEVLTLLTGDDADAAIDRAMSAAPNAEFTGPRVGHWSDDEHE